MGEWSYIGKRRVGVATHVLFTPLFTANKHYHPFRKFYQRPNYTLTSFFESQTLHPPQLQIPRLSLLPLFLLLPPQPQKSQATQNPKPKPTIKPHNQTFKVGMSTTYRPVVSGSSSTQPPNHGSDCNCPRYRAATSSSHDWDWDSFVLELQAPPRAS